MQINVFNKVRTGLQGNARPAGPDALVALAENLHDALAATGLFHSIEVGRTDDTDRLVIAMVGFAPGVDPTLVSGRLEHLWIDRIGYQFWSAHSTIVEGGHVELLAASRPSSQGDYVTMHLVAQATAVPAQRVAPVEPKAVAVVAEPLPKAARSRAGLFGGPALAPA